MCISRVASHPFMKFAFVAAALLIGLARTRLALAGDGALDTSFGNAGTVLSNFSGATYAFAVAFDPPTQKIVAVGLSGCGLVVARYNYNGTLDNTFGSGGKVCTFGSGRGAGFSVLIDANERILAAGDTAPPPSGCYDIALARYNPNGTLDSSFGSSGIVLTTMSPCGNVNAALGIAIQPDGKIVVVGRLVTYFAVLRYNSNGTLDNKFGTAGKFLGKLGDVDNVATGVAIQPDGKIIFVGQALSGGGVKQGVIERLTASGTPDYSFANSGVARNASVVPTAVALTCSGKIVVAGEGPDNFLASGFAFARYNSNGTLDTSFGTNGIAHAFANGGAAFSVAVNPITEMIVGGGTVGSGGSLQWGLVRLNPNGSLDPSFGSNGQVITFNKGDNRGSSVVLLPTLNRTLLGGYVSTSISYDFALARYIGD